MSKAVLTTPLERSTCPYYRSLLSFRMRSRSSMPSCTSSSLDLVVTMSCGLTLQIRLIITLSFRCRCWRPGPINGQVLPAWSTALRTQELHTRPRVLKDRWRELVADPWTSSGQFSHALWPRIHSHLLLRAYLLGSKRKLPPQACQVRPGLPSSGLPSKGRAVPQHRAHLQPESLLKHPSPLHPLRTQCLHSPTIYIGSLQFQF